MIVTVASGKGGTGKTSILAAFAALATGKALCDADVDAADLHLLMNPLVKHRSDFLGGGIAVIDKNKCTECGLCRDLCRFDAISEDFNVDRFACEGCGVCVDLCPEQAVDFPTRTCGEWFISETRFGPMVHARLGIAEENSGKLVALVRQEAKKLVATNGFELIITDGPPGIGCPVIASIGGATMVIIVTEPTVSGLHDMGRVAQLAAHFKIPAMVCVNKFDLNQDQTCAIERKCEENNVRVLPRIPFDPVFTRSMVQGKTIFEYDETAQCCAAVRKIWNIILKQPEMT